VASIFEGSESDRRQLLGHTCWSLGESFRARRLSNVSAQVSRELQERETSLLGEDEDSTREACGPAVDRPGGGSPRGSNSLSRQASH